MAVCSHLSRTDHFRCKISRWSANAPPPDVLSKILRRRSWAWSLLVGVMPGHPIRRIDWAITMSGWVSYVTIECVGLGFDTNPEVTPEVTVDELILAVANVAQDCRSLSPSPTLQGSSVLD